MQVYAYVCLQTVVCVCVMLRKESQREHSLSETWDDAGGHDVRSIESGSETLVNASYRWDS